MALALNTSALAHCLQRSKLTQSGNLFAPAATRVHVQRPARVSFSYLHVWCRMMRMHRSSRRQDRGDDIRHLGCLDRWSSHIDCIACWFARMCTAGSYPRVEDYLAPDMRVSADQASRFSCLHSSQRIGYEEFVAFNHCAAAAKLQQDQHEGSSSQR